MILVIHAFVMIGVKFSHFAHKNVVNKIWSTCSVRDGHTLGVGNFGMEVCINITRRF